jgi:hypothetical protein
VNCGSSEFLRSAVGSRYPVKLFPGVDLVRFLRELKLIVDDHINQDWLAAVSGDKLH